MISIALPKGRLGEKAFSLFEKAGCFSSPDDSNNRKLVIESTDGSMRCFWVKPSDVPIYVERGVADVGVAGSDILDEYEPEVYELCDLGIGVCRMAVASVKGFTDKGDRVLRVATKFPNISRKYYSERGREIDIIKLNGSIELAPILDMSDVIVDIVETGRTLIENGLETIEDVCPISSRLIANKSSCKFKETEIKRIVGLLTPEKH